MHMGYRNHLHVCQHCGLVHATASSTGPKQCVGCDAFTFSEYELNELLHEERDSNPQSNSGDVGRSKRVSSPVGQP